MLFLKYQMQLTPTFGISTQFEIDLEARLPRDPLQFVVDASKAGLYIQYFTRNGRLWARVAGPVDTILDFQTTL